MFASSSHRSPALALGLVMASLIAGPSYAEEERVGSNEYRQSCASCHGADGRGDGPVAQCLNVKLTDLTQLAKNNHGEFPFLKVFHLVDGRTIGGVHGTRAMPIWGDRYAAEAGEQYGPYGAEQVIRGRILELVLFVEAIQEP